MERFLYIAIAALVFAYVMVRAISIPLVHDESVSFLNYAQTGDFLPFASIWDANNHFLSSLCGHIGYRLFGFHLLALRWASVLAFPVYAWAAWRMGLLLQHRQARWPLWLGLLLCPFLLDFFSVFRGYGPALACMLWSLYFAQRFLKDGSHAALSKSLVFMATANGFMLALVPLWGLVLFALLLRCRQRGALMRWVVLGLLPLIGAAGLSMLMSRFGLLYHGTLDGFLHVTVGSLAWRVFGMDTGLIRAAMLFATIAGMLIIAITGSRRNALADHGLFFAALLLAESFGRVFLAHIVGVNYAEDRAALHALVLATLVVGFAADRLAGMIRFGWAFGVLLLALPIRTLLHANLERTVLWPEQSIPDSFIVKVMEAEKQLGRPLLMGVHRHAGLPYALQLRRLGGDGDATAVQWPNSPTDARLELRGLTYFHDPHYALVDSAASGLLLYMRKEPCRGREFMDTAFHVQSVGLERSQGILITADRVRAGKVVLVANGTLSGPDPLDLRVSIGVFDSTGQALHGDHTVLATRRAIWNGESWRSALIIPRFPDAARVEFFLWEPRRQTFTVEHARLRALAMD